MEGLGAYGDLGAGETLQPDASGAAQAPVGRARQGEWVALGCLITGFSLDKQEAQDARVGGGQCPRFGGRKPDGLSRSWGSGPHLCLYLGTTWEFLKNTIAWPQPKLIK